MKTVGEILRKARIEKNLDYEDVEKKTRIRRKFLEAMEQNEWDKLPSETYIKGFLRNYSSFLGLQSDGIIAIFRRQYPQDMKAKVLPDGLSEPLDEPIFKLTPQRFTFIITGFFVALFAVYLVFQYLSFTSAPSLEVLSPKEGQISTSSSINVKGKTNSDATVFINNQKISINDKGEFNERVLVNTGINTLTIESENKTGKKTKVTRTIQVETTTSAD